MGVSGEGTGASSPTPLGCSEVTVHPHTWRSRAMEPSPGTPQDGWPQPHLHPHPVPLLPAGTRGTQSLGKCPQKPDLCPTKGAVLSGWGPLFDFLPLWHVGGGAGWDLFALRSHFRWPFPPPPLFAFPWKRRAGGAAPGSLTCMAPKTLPMPCPS